jgi:hypothetical protein
MHAVMHTPHLNRVGRVVLSNDLRVVHDTQQKLHTLASTTSSSAGQQRHVQNIRHRPCSHACARQQQALRAAVTQRGHPMAAAKAVMLPAGLQESSSSMHRVAFWGRVYLMSGCNV